ncbi:MAG: ketopantoate reductase family protein [Spirochaetota bacterium]
MRCLIVGAGAVGQVYGYHLVQGGAAVSYLVKDKYAESARHGFTLYPLNEKDARQNPILFDKFSVLTNAQQVAQQSWDYVFLTTSSTALRAGGWYAEIAKAIGNAQVIILTVGIEDLAFVKRYTREEHIITGLITMMSYAAPLPGEELPRPGTAYWFPPLLKFSYSGEKQPTQGIVDLLNKGGMPSARHSNVQLEGALGSALLQTSIYALECAGWSLKKMAQDGELLSVTRKAMIEASFIGARKNNARLPYERKLIPGRALAATMQLTQKIAPLDVERFFERHYTKVREQSLDMLSTWIRAGSELGIATPGLEALQQRLAAV